MIAKFAPTSKAIRDQLPTKIMFQNEHVMYTHVLPKFMELEHEAGVPENERLKCVKCYGSVSEEPNEIILLEDLQESNFVMFDKFTPLTDETVKCVLKNFAILHSLSFAWKNKDHEIYEGFRTKLAHPWVVRLNIDAINMYFGQMEDDFIAILDNEEYKKLVRGSLTQLPMKAVENHLIHNKSKYGVIQHGDGWTNNILFKLEGDNLAECCLIDYQLSSQHNPVSDIFYMIFFCTDYETRSKHYHEWIDYYHDQLDKCLANFGLKANTIYPREQYDADLKELGKLYLGFSLMLVGMLMKEAHEAALINETMQNESDMETIIQSRKLSNLGESSVERIKVKIEGLIESFLDLGYLE